MASRAQNERTFKHWEELQGGGRRYFREFAGRAGGRVRYVKEVDATEITIRFAQNLIKTAALSQSTRNFPSI
jgi:hypothetical protein